MTLMVLAANDCSSIRCKIFARIFTPCLVIRYTLARANFYAQSAGLGASPALAQHLRAVIAKHDVAGLVLGWPVDPLGRTDTPECRRVLELVSALRETANVGLYHGMVFRADLRVRRASSLCAVASLPR